MPCSHTLPRTVAAALAITALAAPAALARPIDPPSPAATPAPDPVYWSYEYQASNPETVGAISPAPKEPVPTGGDGAPWAIFALGLAGAALAGAGGKTRLRARRARVTA